MGRPSRYEATLLTLISGLRENDSPETPRPRRQRRRAVSQPRGPKSVAFDFDSKPSRHLDPGYETDDSDSTIDSMRKVHRHNTHRRRHSSSDGYFPTKKHNNKNYDISNDNNGSHPSDNLQRSDSDSTIDLPDRFDSQGRLLPQEESTKPMRDPLEDLINGINRVFA